MLVTAVTIPAAATCATGSTTPHGNVRVGGRVRAVINAMGRKSSALYDGCDAGCIAVVTGAVVEDEFKENQKREARETRVV